MEKGGKREFKVWEVGVSDPPVPLHILIFPRISALCSQNEHLISARFYMLDLSAIHWQIFLHFIQFFYRILREKRSKVCSLCGILGSLVTRHSSVNTRKDIMNKKRRFCCYVYSGKQNFLKWSLFIIFVLRIVNSCCLACYGPTCSLLARSIKQKFQPEDWNFTVKPSKHGYYLYGFR